MTEQILQFFGWLHVPASAKATLEQVGMDVVQQGDGDPFEVLATAIVMKVPRNQERTVCLRQLLKARDAAIRAAIYQDSGER